MESIGVRAFDNAGSLVKISLLKKYLINSDEPKVVGEEENA